MISHALSLGQQACVFLLTVPESAWVLENTSLVSFVLFQTSEVLERMYPAMNAI